MPTIRAGDRLPLGLDVGKVLTVTCDAVSSAIVRTYPSNTQGIQANGSTAVAAGTSVSFGPYLVASRFQVECLVGTVDYVIGEDAPESALEKPIVGTTAAQAAFTSLVSRGGIQKGIASHSIALLGAWGVMPDGRYLTADYFPGSGRGRSSLGLYNGDLAAGYSQANLTSLTNARAADSVLKRPDGTTLNPTGAHIYCAWPTRNGDIYFVAVEGGNFYHLFRCKAGTYTVGANAACDDNKAVLSLGMIGATQTAQNRVFSQRNFCEAVVDGATHLFQTEYNVAAGRVNGGANDAVKAMRSTDGYTFTTFFEFNTDGTHQIDHFHGVKQDPYTGWIYFMTGDTGGQNSIIAYNGKAAPVAANATLATIAATPGYKVISGTELARVTDLCFSEQGLYTVPDADTDTGDPTTRAYCNVTFPRTLDYVVSFGTVDRVNNVPPALTLQSTTLGDWLICFCSGVAFAAGYKWIDLFQADYVNGTWTKVAKLEVRAGAVPKNFFADAQGRLWIYCDSSLWFGPESDYDGTSKTRSLVLTPGDRTAAPYVSVR